MVLASSTGDIDGGLRLLLRRGDSDRRWSCGSNGRRAFLLSDALGASLVTRRHLPWSFGRSFRLGCATFVLARMLAVLTEAKQVFPLDATDLDLDGDASTSIPSDLGLRPRVYGQGLDIGAFEWKPD